MKEDKIIYLVDIRDELQSFIHDDDPNGAFMAGWEWWMDYCVRHRLRHTAYFYAALNRGWISRADAESFCLFLHKAHVWRCVL